MPLTSALDKHLVQGYSLLFAVTWGVEGGGPAPSMRDQVRIKQPRQDG